MTDIIIRTGGVCIFYKNDSIVECLKPIMERLTEYKFDKDWKTKQVTKSIKAQFFIHHPKQKILNFHSVHTEEVLTALRHHPKARTFKVTRQPVSGAVSIDLNYTSPKLPRARQPEYVDFMTDISEHIRVLPSSPGSGKTLCTIFGMTRIKTKTALILQPSLKDNWIDNLKELTDIKDEEITYINGSEGLHEYMRKISDKTDTYKVVIFSIQTLQGYMANYLDDDLGWLYSPDELFDEGGFGLKVVDEAHKWLHFHMLLDMYSNIRNHHFLTGTLMNESPFIGAMENTLFHENDRCEVDPPTNHVHLRSYQYNFMSKAPPHLGAMGYNHMKFEGSIFKNTKLMKAYMKLIGNIFYRDFYKTRVGKDRAVVFFSTVNMVKAFAEILDTVLPELTVVTYLAGDDESKYDDANVIVTTTKKAGTGTDFDNLVYVLQTIMISSVGENYQNVGRLRNLHERKTMFSYIWCQGIPKQVGYHKKRLTDLKPLVCGVEQLIIDKAI